MTTKHKPQRRVTEKKWFSASEAARYLGVSVDKMRQLDESGELPAERTKGGHRRFSRRALDAYLAKQDRRNKPKAQRPTHTLRPIAVDVDVYAFETTDKYIETYVAPPPTTQPPHTFT